jgi:hypothetical protein
MYQALMLAVARNASAVVETGTARVPDNWAGDGQSTLVLGAWCQRYKGRLWTCDIAPQAITASRGISRPFKESIEYRVGDSVAFLKGFDRRIDVLYLDSFDFPTTGEIDPNPPQDHCLKEAQAALAHLHNQSIIILDDCGLPFGGKGGKAIPFLMGEGWQVVGLGYQIVMTLAFPYKQV